MITKNIFKIENNDFSSKYINIILNYQNEIKELLKEIEVFEKNLDYLNFKINTYIRNSILQKFNIEEDVIHFINETTIAICSDSKINIVFNKYKVKSLDQIYKYLPPENIFTLTKKQMNILLKIYNNHCNVYDEYNDICANLEIIYEEYELFLENLKNTVKTIYKKKEIFQDNIHDLIILKNKNKRLELVYLNKNNKQNIKNFIDLGE